jgi:hypothetical protein
MLLIALSAATESQVDEAVLDFPSAASDQHAEKV